MDAVALQRMRGVEHALDRFDAVAFLALRDIVLGEGEIVKDAGGVGPLLEDVVVLEEVVVPERGMASTSVCIVAVFSSMM